MGFAQASNAVPAFARVGLARPAAQPHVAQRLLERQKTPISRPQISSITPLPSADTLFVKIQKTLRSWAPPNLLRAPRDVKAEIVPLRGTLAEQSKQTPSRWIAELMEKPAMSLPDNVFELTRAADDAVASELACLDKYRQRGVVSPDSVLADGDSAKMTATRAYRFTRVIEMIKSIRRTVFDQANTRHGAACHAAINVLSKKWQAEIERGSHRFSRASVVIDLDELIRSLEEVRQMARGLVHEERG